MLMQVGQFGGISDEIDGLKRDKNVLMVELVRLRQQQAQSDLAVRQLQVCRMQTPTLGLTVHWSAPWQIARMRKMTIADACVCQGAPMISIVPCSTHWQCCSCQRTSVRGQLMPTCCAFVCCSCGWLLRTLARDRQPQ